MLVRRRATKIPATAAKRGAHVHTIPTQNARRTMTARVGARKRPESSARRHQRRHRRPNLRRRQRPQCRARMRQSFARLETTPNVSPILAISRKAMARKVVVHTITQWSPVATRTAIAIVVVNRILALFAFRW
jgi:hypothetical protein